MYFDIVNKNWIFTHELKYLNHYAKYTVISIPILIRKIVLLNFAIYISVPMFKEDLLLMTTGYKFRLCGCYPKHLVPNNILPVLGNEALGLNKQGSRFQSARENLFTELKTNMYGVGIFNQILTTPNSSAVLSLIIFVLFSFTLQY